MKKFLIASGVAVLAFASVAAAATFTANLTVGSTGADVVALQNALIAGGFHIPAIESGAASTGYFGTQTQSAVKLYQTAHSIPSTGFVGPLTRAALNSGSVVATCPAGQVCTPVATVVTCPAGYTCTPVGGTVGTVGAPVGIATPGVVGTLAVSLWSTPSGIVAYKGQSYDVSAYKIQASASDMAIQNLTLDFDVRLWLYASAITIKDDSGAVVGSITNLSSSNFSELTVGSDYRVSVPVSGYVVHATQTRYLTVNVSFLPTSDRSTGTVTVLQAQIRSVDGTGVTDTEHVGTGTTVGAVNGTDYRQFSYQGNGAGSIIVTTDSSSPATGLVQLSTSAQTNGVVLGIFDIKSQNAPSTLRSLTLVVHTSGPATVATLFSNIQVKIGGLVYSANSITANAQVGVNGSSTVVFNNMTVPLPADTYIPITVLANASVDTNGTLDGTVASTTFAVSSTGTPVTSANPDVEDQSYNILAVNTATFTANNLTFTGSSVQASPSGVTYGGLNNNTTTGSTTQQFTFAFSLTAGNNPIYVSSDQAVAISSSTSGNLDSISPVNFSDSDTSGDATGFFYLAPGQTKTFSAIYSASGLSSQSGVFYATSINYGTTTAATGGTLNQSTIQNSLKAILFH